MEQTQPPAGLVCPHCRVDLVMSERQRVEIDYCPKCRGIWLDRGELDTIIERAGPRRGRRLRQPRSSRPEWLRQFGRSNPPMTGRTSSPPMGIGATTTRTATIVSMTIMTKGTIAGRASSGDFSTESLGVGAAPLFPAWMRRGPRERKSVGEERTVWSQD